jgi:hypothetical protein
VIKVFITTHNLFSALNVPVENVLMQTECLLFSHYLPDSLKISSTEDAMPTAPLGFTIAPTFKIAKPVLNFALLATRV